MATSPIVDQINADWDATPYSDRVPIWYLHISERHRGMAFKSFAATAEDAEAEGLAEFVKRFPNRLEST